MKRTLVSNGNPTETIVGFSRALSSSNRFYLRVGPSNIDDFVSEGMEQFTGRKGSAGMPYYEVPEHVLEDTDSLRGWAIKARQAAVVAKLGSK